MNLENTMKKGNPVSRRKLLSAGTVAALTSIAGCSGSGGISGVVEDATSSVSGSSKLDYTQWAYAPDVLDSDHYQFFSLDPISIDEIEDEFDDNTFDQLEGIEREVEPSGIDFDEMGSFLSLQGHSIFTSSEFESEEELLDELDDEADLDDDDEIGDYTVVYDDDDDLNRGAAVNGNTVILTQGNLSRRENNAEDVLEAIIETKAGEEDRYIDENDDFNLLTEKLGQATIVAGRTHEEFEGTPQVDLQPGDTVSDVLRGTDPQYNERYYKPYTFEANGGDFVTINMESQGDAYLFLVDPDGNVIQSDDDGGSGVNSRIQTRLRQAGVYEIRASHYSGHNVGQGMPFNLSFSNNQSGRERNTATLGLEGERARGSAITIEGEEATRKWVFVYDSDGDVDTGELEEQFEAAQDESDALDEYTDITASQDGRTATLTATIDTDEITRPFSFFSSN